MEVTQTKVDAVSRKALKQNPNERGTNIPLNEWVDLGAYDAGCMLIEVSGENDYRQGGIEVASGSWSAVKKLYDERLLVKNNSRNFHIRIPNGTYYPADYTGRFRNYTFVEAVKAGQAKLSDIDGWVDAWHRGAGTNEQTLQDYLGLSNEIYSAWLKREDALLAILG